VVDPVGVCARRNVPRRSIQKRVDESDAIEGEYVADVSPEEADSIRDACGEQLQRVGFDEDYKPTKESAVLEALIDTLFVR
jgi:hypothetical protein